MLESKLRIATTGDPMATQMCFDGASVLLAVQVSYDGEGNNGDMDTWSSDLRLRLDGCEGAEHSQATDRVC